MKGIKFLAIFLVKILTFVQGDSPVTCASDNVACTVHEDNLLDIVGDVASIEECRQLCYYMEDCDYLTYYDINGSPFIEVCQLFSSCEQTHNSTNCVSETRTCYNKCGKKVLGVLGDNILGAIGDVNTALDCKENCRTTSNCSFYSYFTEEDEQNPRFCILLSSLIEPFQPCDNCFTGPLDCQNTGECSLMYNGESYQSLMFDSPGIEVNVSTTPFFEHGNCQLRVLAIGGGGGGLGGGGVGSGGGSGYIHYHTKDLIGATLISLNVGEERQSSNVTINGDVIEAAPGHRDDGYSGGGASSVTGWIHCCNPGGSNGRNGSACVCCGGKGTGEDVASYKFDNFLLTPGVGGECYSLGDGLPYSGGGGGGVLVNGAGPERDNVHQGEGYGGGRGHGTDVNDGLQG